MKIVHTQQKKNTNIFAVFFYSGIILFVSVFLLLQVRELFDTRLREKLIIFNFFRIIPKGTVIQKHSHHHGEMNFYFLLVALFR